MVGMFKTLIGVKRLLEGMPIVDIEPFKKYKPNYFFVSLTFS